jgi:oligo-1,6-glucosidase
MYRERVTEGGADPAAVMESIYAKSRDNARTPMQWEDGENAGFTTGTPWLKVNPNYRQINARAALEDPNSIFHYYRQLIALRKRHPIIVYGSYEPTLPDHEHIYAYIRKLGEARLLVLLNFTDHEAPFDWKEIGSGLSGRTDGVLLIGNYPDGPAAGGRRDALRPYEALVYMYE